MDYDKDNINPQFIKTLEEKIVDHPKFNQKDAWGASKAAGYLFGWVKAMYDYYKVFVTSEPIRKQLMDIQKVVDEKKEILGKKMAELDAVNRKIAKLQNDFNE